MLVTVLELTTIFPQLFSDMGKILVKLENIYGKSVFNYRLFWNDVTTEPICNAGIVVEKCSVSVWRQNTFSVKLGKVYGCRIRLV